ERGRQRLREHGVVVDEQNRNGHAVASKLTATPVPSASTRYPATGGSGSTSASSPRLKCTPTESSLRVVHARTCLPEPATTRMSAGSATASRAAATGAVAGSPTTS